MSDHRLPAKKWPLHDRTNIWQLHSVEREKEVTSFTDERIQGIRDVAGELGYAIAVHGSLDRDIDLVACPWTADAVDVWELLGAITSRRGLVITGVTKKPHGRIGFTLEGRGAKTIDLSVMPLRSAP